MFDVASLGRARRGVTTFISGELGRGHGGTTHVGKPEVRATNGYINTCLAYINTYKTLD